MFDLDETAVLLVAKVVVNRKYGGFGLSAEAFALGEKLSGKANWGRDEFGAVHVERHDPILVQVVETLGDAANGHSARLEVEELRLGYGIEDHDGKETVHRL